MTTKVVILLSEQYRRENNTILILAKITNNLGIYFTIYLDHKNSNTFSYSDLALRTVKEAYKCFNIAMSKSPIMKGAN